MAISYARNRAESTASRPAAATADANDDQTNSDDEGNFRSRLNEELAAQYWPLAKCVARVDDLYRRRRKKHARRWLGGLIVRLELHPGLSHHPAFVRFVAVSDTHRYHDKVDLPAGEVLLYAGDSVGNYGRSSDISRHFAEFLSWLAKQSRRFARVYFIAGNHETFLDDQLFDAAAGVDQLHRFLAATRKCIYLENGGAVYRGIQLFGSPITVSRVETEGKRYYSRAFERFADQRAEVWADLPEGLDLLMTHCPPRGHLCHCAAGDPLLTERLGAMLSPPRFHVFGHDHDFLGVDRDERTIFLNVAQDECLRTDPNGGGCPLIFDIIARDDDGG